MNFIQKISLVLITFIATLPMTACQTTKKSGASNQKIVNKSELLQNARQFTFSGKRAGEGYFSADGKKMIFQSEREPNNPFYQIYVMDMQTQKISRVSNGDGKTTCSWIFPDGKNVIYSSTFADPQTKALQKEELESRAAGKQKRYAWDYDPQYEIYSDKITGGQPVNLTRALGYDAEGSASPDGEWIVFSSNRHAYTSSLSEADQKKLTEDPSYFLDLYLMDKDGKQLKRLTNAPGYDGGPFFSPDGKSIVFRRFSPDGSSAEVYTMNLATMEEKQITHLGAMSWAPFYHPSGDYIVFTSNLYGFTNFELFIVDTNGTNAPVRITDSDGFDGLPVFVPSGERLTWNRKMPTGESQIFIADWNDTEARKSLGLLQRFPTPNQLKSSIEAEDAQAFVSYLASEQMKGRATGSDAEKIYTQKFAEYFKSLGLSPLNGSYFQDFSISKAARIGSGNTATVIGASQTQLKLGDNWTPLSFSKSSGVAAGPIQFVGYGIVAAASNEQPAYDSYQGVDVTGKWVMLLSFVPEDVDRNLREHLLRYSRLEHKVSMARQRGARGVIVVYGPRSNTKSSLPSFLQGSSTDAGVATLAIDTRIAKEWFEKSNKNLDKVQKQLDQGETVEPFLITDTRLSSDINLVREKGQARNTLALLRAPGAVKTLVIGAHADHLGQGPSPSSLMNSSDKTDIHFGADDNASGVAGVLELAHYFSNESKKQMPRHNILFALWSGEELGNLGSTYFVDNLKRSGLSISAYLNMDMIGRLTNAGQIRPLAIQGVGSSSDWRTLIEGLPKDIGLSLSDDPYLPTDAMSFYIGEIPVLSFFTGVHQDYHTPRDTSNTLDYFGLQKTLSLVGSLAQKLAWDGRIPKYVKIEPNTKRNHRGFRIFLGTIPDYTNSDVKGVKLSGVIKGGPAEKAGLQDGDIIVRLSTFDIQNLHDYTFSLESIKPGEETTLTVLREGQEKELRITPQSRE